MNFYFRSLVSYRFTNNIYFLIDATNSSSGLRVSASIDISTQRKWRDAAQIAKRTSPFSVSVSQAPYVPTLDESKFDYLRYAYMCNPVYLLKILEFYLSIKGKRIVPLVFDYSMTRLSIGNTCFVLCLDGLTFRR